MGCFIALFALVSPRLALFLLALFSNVLSHAFDGHHVTGFEWFFVALAFIVDVGSYAGGGRARSQRSTG